MPQDLPAAARDAQFRTDLGAYDSNSGFFYTNLFDKIVDGVYAALNATGFSDMELLIGEASLRHSLIFVSTPTLCS